MSATSEVNARLARALHHALEPFHTVAYVARQVRDEFQKLGITNQWSGYFGTRIAPLGAVPASVVEALFYHFHPRMIAREVMAVWDVAAPATVLTARLTGVDAALRKFVPDAVGSAEIAEAAKLARTASAGCVLAGRPLAAANAALPLPDEPHLALWQTLGTLREFRGDGHVAALLAAGLDAVETLVTATAAGIEERASIQPRREWTDADWTAAQQRLTERGLLDSEGALTADGTALRRAVEDSTDRLALAPWQELGRDGCTRLYELVQPVSARLVRQLRLPLPCPPDEIPE